MHQSSHTITTTCTYNNKHKHTLKYTQTQSHNHTNTQTLPIYYSQQNLICDMTGFEASGGWPVQKVLSSFCHIFAPSTHCKCEFIPLTSHQWVSTWNPRAGHITLSVVPSKLSTAFFMVKYTHQLIWRA